MNTTQETTIALTRADYAAAITAAWRDSVAGIIETGKRLVESKAGLPHGEFGQMFAEHREIPFGRTRACMLMAIAESEVLANFQHIENLPASWATLYEMTRLPEELLTACLSDGRISADTERSDVAAMVSAQRRIRKAKTEADALAAAPMERPWLVTPDQSVIQCNALITDPPYGILDEAWEPADLETFTREWAGRWAACGADFILVFWSQRYLWQGRQWFDESFSDHKFQQLLMWHYPNNKSPQSRMGFKQTWEPVFFYRRKDSTREIGVSSQEWGDDLHDFDCHVSAVPQSNFNDEDFKQHPAQKSASVMRWLVNATTMPGDLVCDPFCGSGTTGIAASQLNRRFHGIEIDPEYRQLAERRLAAHGRVVIPAA